MNENKTKQGKTYYKHTKIKTTKIELLCECLVFVSLILRDHRELYGDPNGLV